MYVYVSVYVYVYVYTFIHIKRVYMYVQTCIVTVNANEPVGGTKLISLHSQLNKRVKRLYGIVDKNSDLHGSKIYTNELTFSSWSLERSDFVSKIFAFSFFSWFNIRILLSFFFSFSLSFFRMYNLAHRSRF